MDTTKHIYHRYLSLQEAHNKNYLNNASIGHLHVKNGFILPVIRPSVTSFLGGVVNSEKKFVAGLIRHHDLTDWGPSCNKSYDFDENSVTVSNESVVFGGILMPHFGHFLIESLSRLWYVVQNKEILENHKIVFVFAYEKVPSFAYEFFDLIGIPLDKIVFLKNITKFDEIIVPDQSGYLVHYVHKEYLYVYDEMVRNSHKKYTGDAYKKIFLSRSKCKTGYKLIGEEYFEKFFEEHGFKVLYPDEMSMTEKVFLISSADEVVATCGTISHYSLFAKKDSKFVIIGRNFNDCPISQIIVNTVKGYDYRLIDCSYNFLFSDLYRGVSLLYPTKYWAEYVKDTYNELEIAPMDSSYIFEYIKYFYQFYKNTDLFNFNSESFVRDFFKRCGRLFFDEDFISLINDKNK